MKILVVDSNPEIADVLSSMLEFEGHQVVVEPCEESAFERLKQGEMFGLMILDFCSRKKAGMNIIDLLIEIEADEDLPAIPTVLLVKKHNKQGVARTFSNVQAIFEKPCDGEGILSVVKQCEEETRVSAPA